MLVEVDLDAEAGEEDGEANDVVSNLVCAFLMYHIRLRLITISLRREHRKI